MADLVIKVSEKKYEDTLQRLQTQLNTLNGYKEELDMYKQNMSKEFIGELGDDTVQLINNNAKNVAQAIEKTEKAITEIKKYMDSMKAEYVSLRDDVEQASRQAQDLLN